MHRDSQLRALEHLLRAYALMHGLPVNEARLATLNVDNINGFAVELACSEIGSVLRICGVEPSTLILGDIDLEREISTF
jgi:hypothetical protein